MLYKDAEMLTQDECNELVAFFASIIANLVECNNEALADGEDFVRLCDVQEVISTLADLHKHANYADYDYDYENATASTTKQAAYNITAAQAREALYCYDTEYREQIMEQFEDACATLASKLWRNVDSGMLLNKIVTFK